MMRLLSLSGGGIRGYLQALVLAELESRTGLPTCNLFEGIFGTSTGGILAAGLALGKPASAMAAFYREHGPRIFRRSCGKRLRSLFGLADESYDADGLEEALEAVFGNAALSQAQKSLCLTAYDIEARRPVLFRSWQARANAADDHLMTAVCRATAAAPTYFEPALVKNATGLMRACVDGGVWANNPAMVAVVEAIKLGHTPRRIRLVSVGTGCDERPYLLSDARGWGLAGWARPLLDILFSGQSDAVDHQCGEILGSHFVRLQPTLSEPVAMDAVDDRAFSTMAFHAGRLAESADMDLALKLVRGA